MKIVIILVFTLAGLLFISKQVSNIIVHFKVKRYRKFLENNSVRNSAKEISNQTEIKKRFCLIIKMLSRHKDYRLVALFSEYLLAIKGNLEFIMKTNAEEVYSLENLRKIGYSYDEWILLCESISDLYKDQILLKELFWWPALSLKLEINSILKST